MVIQVSEYLLDYSWIFDTGNNLDLTSALSAGFNINIK